MMVPSHLITSQLPVNTARSLILSTTLSTLTSVLQLRRRRLMAAASSLHSSNPSKQS